VAVPTAKRATPQHQPLPPPQIPSATPHSRGTQPTMGKIGLAGWSKG